MRRIAAVLLISVQPILVYAGASTLIKGDILQASTSGRIGSTGSPDSKAVLDLVSTTKSLLLPRMTTTQRDAISSPPEGSLIENTSTNTLDWYTGSAWKQVVSLAGTETLTNKTLTSPTINTPTLVGSGGTLTLPAGPDTLVGRATADTLTNKTLDADGTGNSITNIENADIKAAAGIVDTKLATISTAGKVSNSATTAASANTASAIVARDGSGNFSAGTVTAALTGTASGNTTYTANQYGVVLSGSGNTMSVLAPDSSTTKVLTSGGTSANPSWAAVSGGSESEGISNASIIAAVSSNTLVLSLKQSDGSSDCSAGSPCIVNFRSSTATTGGYSSVSFTSAASLTLGTADSIGFTASTAGPLYVYLVSDSTNEVCASVKLFDQGTVQSATAMTGGAEVTSTTLYCTSAHTSKPVRLVGRVWATWSNPNWGSITKVEPWRFELLDRLGNDGTRSALTGQVGEYIESTQTSLTSFGATTGQIETCVSISLTAGDWDISGVLDAQGQAAASVTEVALCAGGTASGNNSAGCTFGTNYLAQDFTTGLGNGIPMGLSIPSYRVSPTTTTTYHLKQGFSFITTAPKTRCRISARRVR